MSSVQNIHANKSARENNQERQMPDERCNSELIKIDQLAEWFGWAGPTAYREYARIGVPFLKIGGSLRFRVGAVREWLAEQENQRTSGPAV